MGVPNHKMKFSIIMDKELVNSLDTIVKAGQHRSRSQLIEQVINNYIEKEQDKTVAKVKNDIYYEKTLKNMLKDKN